MLLEDMLDDLGCCVAGMAARPAQALAAIDAAQPIDAAILDLNLDGQRSYDVADALAARGVPFVFATGYGPAGLIEAYRDRPVLRKPFSYNELARALSDLLSP
jgi:CheY-like chemotaxis protein